MGYIPPAPPPPPAHTDPGYPKGRPCLCGCGIGVDDPNWHKSSPSIWYRFKQWVYWKVTEHLER